MKQPAVELLLIFLESNNLILFIKIINSHLNIYINKSLPDSDSFKIDVGLTGSNLSEISQINNEQLKLGKLPLNPLLVEQMERFFSNAIPNKNSHEPDNTDENESTNPVNPTALQKAFEEIKEADINSPSPQDIPLPPFKGSDVVKLIDKLKDLSCKAKIDSTNFPSICMFTLHNTDDTLDSTEDSIKLIGHSGPVYSLDISSDNKFMISGSEDKTGKVQKLILFFALTLRLWNLDTYSNLVSYRGHNYPVWDVTFSPINLYFASSSFDKTARLWSCEHIYPLRIFAGHLSDVSCVKFHPNGNYLLTGSDDRTVRLWDVQRGKCVRLFTGHSGPITSICISPNGKVAATASTLMNKKRMLNKSENMIKVWDLGSGKLMDEFVGHDEPVYSLCFNHESNLLLSGSADGSVKAWKINSGNDQNKFRHPVNPENLDTSISRTKYFGNNAAGNSTIENGSNLDGNRQLDSLKQSGDNSGNDTLSNIKKEEDIRKFKGDASNREKEKVSEGLLRSWSTVNTSVISVKFSTRNLGIAIGSYKSS
ncbi:Transcription initiation factor TFIID subunit 5 [Smittium culicis]|uniref:Transcription initiation factor TFIID subunit 5 n=1 Tax=Smittium culicis TaxID=133412 RepID=A0A1R1X5R6_9FUNG|nr:Transcription initiation factor TFIID subunit 5 [Smittium culicis]